MKALLLAAAIFFTPAAALAQDVCHDEADITEQADAAALPEYRRAEHLEGFDLVVAYLNKAGNGVVVMFNQGCAVQILDTNRRIIDQHFDHQGEGI